MSRVAYVDRHYLPHRSAAVYIEDRVYQFVRIDGAPVARGTPGPLTCRLRGCYLGHTAAPA